MRKFDTTLIAIISIAWALFQLSLPKLLILDSIRIRSIHLAFAVVLIFLSFPFYRRRMKDFVEVSKSRIPIYDYVLAVFACFAVLYLMIDWTGISMRAGRPILRDIIVSVFLIIILFEASRRSTADCRKSETTNFGRAYLCPSPSKNDQPHAR